MKTILTAAAALLSAVTLAQAGTYRIDTVQSTLPVNYPVYTAAAQVVVQPPAIVEQPAVVAPAPVVVQSPVVAPAPLVAPAPIIAPAPVYAPAPVVVPAPVVTYRPYSYYAPAPVYYAPVRAKTIVRPWGARTVYRYW